MGYSQYLEMIGMKIVDAPRVRRVEFEGGVELGKQGYATVWFENEIPVYCRWYVWDMTDEWFAEELKKIVGQSWQRCCIEHFGGGHYCCTFKKEER